MIKRVLVRKAGIAELALNGEDLPARIKAVKGSEYTFITVEPGKTHAIAVDYSSLK